jgi:hypothetical protein
MENENYSEPAEKDYEKYETSEKSEFIELDKLMMQNNQSKLEIEATLSDDID